MPRIMIDEDGDMPGVVNTETKQIKWAKQLVAEHLGSPSKRGTWLPPYQGSYSRTILLELQDGRNVVIQFRVEPLDIDAFTTAQKVLGSFVPDVKFLPNKKLEEAGVWAYCMNRIPGEIWFRGEKTDEDRIKINKSLGRLFSKEFIADNSSEAVKSMLRPQVDKLLASMEPKIQRFQETLKCLSDKLAQLPLWVAHFDLSEANVLVDESHEVTRVIDWEESVPLPFGVGFGRIHSNTGVFHQGEFFIEPEFEEAERGFWDELFGGMPEQVRAQVQKHIDLVQDAVILGTLLNTLVQHGGEITWTEPSLNALAKWITYRLPFLRKGTEGAYEEPAKAN
ncbi:hypothetical protein GGR55DRAFT_68853 [Xylaria sp. FL0064]|nr:hypothetical protein GGR55DRAFT_68853 [Xylaria sp. FL0064]